MSSEEESQASAVGPSSGDHRDRPEQSEAITIKNIEMTKEMKDQAVLAATNAIEINSGNLHRVASDIAKTFDMKYGPSWNCVVSKDYGCSIVHEPNQYIEFRVGETGVLLFKVAE